MRRPWCAQTTDPCKKGLRGGRSLQEDPLQTILQLLLFLLIARRSPEPEKAITPSVDLKALADAANESAKREASQWFFFVTILITLAAIVGSTTHRVLLLEGA